MELTKEQLEMLKFLIEAKTSKEHPIDLGTAFDLTNKKKKTYYNGYMFMKRDGLISGGDQGYWITENGLTTYELAVEANVSQDA